MHLSVHTFTPVLDGDVRRADVGLPVRSKERVRKIWTHKWMETIKQSRPDPRCSPQLSLSRTR